MAARHELEKFATYLDTETGWKGRCMEIREGAPEPGRTYVVDDREVQAIGPDPSDRGQWVVSIDGGLERVAVDEFGLRTRVGLIGPGPKGVDEIRYSNAQDLSEIDPSEVETHG